MFTNYSHGAVNRISQMKSVIDTVKNKLREKYGQAGMVNFGIW